MVAEVLGLLVRLIPPSIMFPPSWGCCTLPPFLLSAFHSSESGPYHMKGSPPSTAPSFYFSALFLLFSSFSSIGTIHTSHLFTHSPENRSLLVTPILSKVVNYLLMPKSMDSSQFLPFLIFLGHHQLLVESNFSVHLSNIRIPECFSVSFLFSHSTWIPVSIPIFISSYIYILFPRLLKK